MPYGRTLLTATSPFPTRCSADGSPKYKAGGITLDLTTIPTAPGSDVTLPDGSVIKAGTAYLRYGQILTKNTTVDVQTLAGTATSGAFTLSYNGVASASLNFNATAAQIQAALQGIPAIGVNGVAVTGGALGSANAVVTFGANIVQPALLTLTNSTLAGGTVTITHTTTGTAAAGKWGPYDSAATDGRQTLSRGNAVILDETWIQSPAGSTFAGLGGTDTIGGVVEGGDVWFDRLLITAGTHSLAAGPTIAEFEAVFPRVTYYRGFN